MLHCSQLSATGICVYIITLPLGFSLPCLLWAGRGIAMLAISFLVLSLASFSRAQVGALSCNFLSPQWTLRYQQDVKDSGPRWGVGGGGDVPTEPSHRGAWRLRPQQPRWARRSGAFLDSRITFTFVLCTSISVKRNISHLKCILGEPVEFFSG